MEEENKQEERNLELCSEKVRSIVGQIPSSLVRFGITAIGAVLLCFFGVAYFLPYKQVYSGTATVHGVTTTVFADSTETKILLRFENRRPNNVNGQSLYLQSLKGGFVGKMLSLSTVRDTLERQEAVCRFKSTEVKSLENQTVDFQVVLSSGNLLQNLLGNIGL